MVTLVNVELFGQGVLGQDQNEAALLLLRFLIALPIGALLGGWIATKIGDRIVAFAGLLIAAGGYWLVSGWPVDLLAARHDLGFVQPAGAGHRPGDRRPGPGPGDRAADVGDAAGGARRPARHRLGGRGGGPDDRHADRRRGAERLGPVPVQPDPAERCRSRPGRDNLPSGWPPRRPTIREAYVLQYGEIFTITAIVCVVGALLGLLISGRHEHADDRAARSGADAAADRCDARGEPRDTAARRSAALEAAPASARLLDRCRLVGGQPRNASQMTALRLLRIDGTNAEPVLQCSHARCPLFVLTSAQLVGESALVRVYRRDRPDWLLAAPGMRAKANNLRGENSCQLH